MKDEVQLPRPPRPMCRRVQHQGYYIGNVYSLDQLRTYAKKAVQEALKQMGKKE